MKTPTHRQFNITVVFHEDERANDIAFENAVRAILFKGEKEKLTKMTNG